MSESVQHDEQGSSLHDRWCLRYDEQCSSLHAEGLNKVLSRNWLWWSMVVMVSFICAFTQHVCGRKITTRGFPSTKFVMGVVYGKMKVHTYVDNCIPFMSGCEICEGITCICCSGNDLFLLKCSMRGKVKMMYVLLILKCFWWYILTVSLPNIRIVMYVSYLKLCYHETISYMSRKQWLGTVCYLYWEGKQRLGAAVPYTMTVFYLNSDWL